MATTLKMLARETEADGVAYLDDIIGRPFCAQTDGQFTCASALPVHGMLDASAGKKRARPSVQQAGASDVRRANKFAGELGGGQISPNIFQNLPSLAGERNFAKSAVTGMCSAYRDSP